MRWSVSITNVWGQLLSIWGRMRNVFSHATVNVVVLLVWMFPTEVFYGWVFLFCGDRVECSNDLSVEGLGVDRQNKWLVRVLPMEESFGGLGSFFPSNPLDAPGRDYFPVNDGCSQKEWSLKRVSSGHARACVYVHLLACGSLKSAKAHWYEAPKSGNRWSLPRWDCSCSCETEAIVLRPSREVETSGEEFCCRDSDDCCLLGTQGSSMSGLGNSLLNPENCLPLEPAVDWKVRTGYAWEWSDRRQCSLNLYFIFCLPQLGCSVSLSY